VLPRSLVLSPSDLPDLPALSRAVCPRVRLL
jgi:hypothetical protein